jgi:hypothetical protein
MWIDVLVWSVSGSLIGLFVYLAWLDRRAKRYDRGRTALCGCLDRKRR